MQWKHPNSIPARMMVDTLNQHNAELICVTEGHVNQLPGEWYACPSQANHGYTPVDEQRRKVILFSRRPWVNVDAFGNEELPPGRFVAASTITSLGSLHCVGVCIPWADAHVVTGLKNKVRWQDHKKYLSALRMVVAQIPDDSLILGDFNQRIPRKYNPQETAELLMQALGDHFQIATGGKIPVVNEQSIDHLAIGAGLTCQSVIGLSKIRDSIELSDHFGLIAKIGRKKAK